LATSAITPVRIGLRSYDIALGFRNLNERSGLLSEFERTHSTGMAAILAGAIKGRDVIRDARALKAIAAEVLKINPWAFDGVIRELADLDLVRDVRTQGGEIVSFSEQVPLFYDGVHERLGANWLDKRPSELERQLLAGVDALSQSPVPADELSAALGVDGRTEQRLRAVGEGAELVRYLQLRDGTELAVTPLYVFESPDALAGLFEHHASERVSEAWERVRAHPGYPLLLNGREAVVEEMVRSGLVQAPTVVGADGRKRAFVVLPYGLDPAYLTTKKQVLERALVLIACVRCGEISGGATSIRMPDRLLAALMDPTRDYKLGAHSSTQRQYAPLIRMGVIQAVPADGLPAARLVPTRDNLEAVRLARLILGRKGEGDPERGNEREAAGLLFTGREYMAPIETIHAARGDAPDLPDAEVLDLWERIAGRSVR
jgi:hypothetical protein